MQWTRRSPPHDRPSQQRRLKDGGSSRCAGSAAQTVIGWLFVLPALVMYAAFVLLPLALTVQYSLYRWDGIGPIDSGWASRTTSRS